jgi:hypothetical protein
VRPPTSTRSNRHRLCARACVYRVGTRPGTTLAPQCNFLNAAKVDPAVRTYIVRCELPLRRRMELAPSNPLKLQWPPRQRQGEGLLRFSKFGVRCAFRLPPDLSSCLSRDGSSAFLFAIAISARAGSNPVSRKNVRSQLSPPAGLFFFPDLFLFVGISHQRKAPPRPGGEAETRTT